MVYVVKQKREAASRGEEKTGACLRGRIKTMYDDIYG